MIRFLSRFNPRSLRSLIYMLQASEYDVRDYLTWCNRVKNFARVEKRKSLRWTAKAILLYIAGWFFVACWFYFEYRAYKAVQAGSDVPLVVGILTMIVFPLLLQYLLIVALYLLDIVQWPIEQWMIAQAKRKIAAHKATKVAIAGSYGKTSMREILKTILSEGKKVAAPGGSENTPIAIARFVNRLKGDEEVLIFELGEYYPGDVKALAEMVQPDIGVITGVNEAHLSKFKSIESTANTIFELADTMIYQSKKSLYINAESAHLKPVQGAQYYSRDGIHEWNVVAAETSLDGTAFVLEGKETRIEAQTKLLGLHQIGPLSAAAHLAFKLGLFSEQIERGIAKTKPFSHRLERRDDASDVITLDDSYNGNPDGVKAVIDFLGSLEGHRRWYVTPGLVEMGTRSEAIHKDIGRQLAATNIEKVVLIRNSVTPWIEQGLKEHNFRGEIVWFDDALKCYAALPTMTIAGDVVLLQNDWPDQYF